MSNRSSRRARIRRVLAAGLALATVVALAPAAHADMPFPTPQRGHEDDYANQLRIGSGDCSQGADSTNDLPSSFDCVGDWKFSDYRDTSDAGVADNPQEFYGVEGMGLNKAWEVSTGRPDVTIAVLDSGIRWEEQRPELLRKYHLNRAELPRPEDAQGNVRINLDDTRFGGYDVDGDTNHDGKPDGHPDGVFNVADYWSDARVKDLNGNGEIDPEDLIRTFSDGVDADHNGYVDDISGWDFFEDDNDPMDDVDYGHGTGEAEDSNGEAGFTDGTCPSCTIMPLRVGDSFVADVNHFGEAVTYATDNGVSVVQEALGTINHTSFAQAALDYAYQHGVIVNASMADEAAGHHMWPAAYDHTMPVNSIRTASLPTTKPQSYLYFNGCTNYGGYLYLAIPSTSCSSEATGRSSGISGLLQSAARNAVERGEMTPYVRDDGSKAGFPLSAEEAMQLWRLSADDIDFASSCPGHDFCDQAPEGTDPQAPAGNYGTTTPASERYRTVKGWDYFTGYGRPNAARLLRFIGVDGAKEYVPADGPYGVGDAPELTAQDRIPPEADLTWPRWWGQYGVRDDGTLTLPDDPNAPDQIVIQGRAAANRVTAAGGTFDWVLEYAPGVQAAPGTSGADASGEDSGGPWTTIAHDEGLTHAVDGELGRVSAATLRDAVANGPTPWTAGEDPTSEFQPERYAVRLRLRVIAHPVDPADDVNNEAVHQKQIDVYPATEDAVRDDLGVPIARDASGAVDDPGIGITDRLNTGALGRYAGGAGSPSYHDLNGDGVDEVLLATSDGVIHAFTNVKTGEELPGWPVHVGQLPSVARHMTSTDGTPVDNAFTRGDVTSKVYGSVLLGTLAAQDLDGDGTLEVAIGDLEGRMYVFEPDGSLRDGFPTTVDFSLSKEPSCEGQGIASGGTGRCDDYVDTTDPYGEASAVGDAPGGPVRDRWNGRDWGINSAPAIGDIDPSTPGQEIVVGANDAHIYAWHADGTPVAGWPVVLRDPAKVKAMDPQTHFWVYNDDANPAIGTKVLVSPSLADLDGDGTPEVLAAVNEEYTETPNTNPVTAPVATAAASALGSGNTRLYVLDHRGADAPQTDASKATPHTQDQAYWPGWPVKMGLLVTDLLPYVAAGPNTQPIVFDADGDGTPEIAAASAAGPGYVFEPDGTSHLGSVPGSGDNTLATSEPGAVSTILKTVTAAVLSVVDTLTATAGDASRQAFVSMAARVLSTTVALTHDVPEYIALGGLAVGSMDGGLTTTIAGPGAGLRRVLDIVLEARQVGTADYLNLWDPNTGQLKPDAPVVVNDLQFFNHPAIADVTGDGNAEALQASAVGDLVAASSFPAPAVRREFTGGWTVSTPTVGPAPGLDTGHLELTSMTREGYLRFWPTGVDAGTPTAWSTAACTAVSQWPEYGHDAANSGSYTRDAERPSPVGDLQASVGLGGTVALSFAGSGDDRSCGTADHYEVRVLPGAPAQPDWARASELTTLPTAPGDTPVPVGTVERGTHTLLVRAFDDAGNGSAVVAVVVHR